MPAPHVMLITGASSGLGRSLVEAALAKGDIVVATLRKPKALDDLKSKYSSDRLLVLPLDVTKSEEVKAVFAEAKETFGRLDAVFNNAGTFIVGELEYTSEDQARALFETNFFGAISVTREAVALFREQGSGGHLFQITSSNVSKPPAGTSVYSASKAALETLSDALRDELDPAWGIKVTNVKLSGTRTSLFDKGTAPARNDLYSNPALPQNQMFALIQSGKFPLADSDKAAKALLDKLDLPKEERPHRLLLGAYALDCARERASILTELVEHDEAVALSVM
ncbi:hypothetical protein JCM10207_005303 [Rhodosporidiobolus poonsookiae]